MKCPQKPVYGLVKFGLVGVGSDKVADDTLQNGFLEIFVFWVPALLGIPINDDEHETVGGFLMNRFNKIPEPGDESIDLGARFIVEKVSGKRVSSVTVQVLPPVAQGEDG